MLSPLTEPTVQISMQRVPQARLPSPDPRMCDPGEQQWVATEDLSISLPRQPHPASSTTEPLPPGATNFPIELHDAFVVRRSSVVLVVAPELGVKGLLLFLHRIVAVLPAPVGDCLQAPAEPLLHRPHFHCEFPFPAACADVGEAEEIERGWFLPLPLCSFLRESPKLHQPGLLRVERQTVSRTLSPSSGASRHARTIHRARSAGTC